jgi:hypothetical protein
MNANEEHTAAVKTRVIGLAPMLLAYNRNAGMNVAEKAVFDIISVRTSVMDAIRKTVRMKLLDCGKNPTMY